jgi:WD40 repeat protein
VATGVPGPVLSTGAWIQDMTGLGDGTPRLAVATGTGLFVTDCLTGAHVQSPPSGCAEQVQSLAAGRLAADGWAFAAGSDDDHDAGWLSLFDGTGYPVRRPVPAHPDDCGALVFLPTPRGVVLVSGGGAEVRFWDPATLEPAETPLPLREPDRLDEYWVLGLAVVRDDSRALLAVGDSDGIVRLWDPVAWRPVTEIETRHGIDALHAVPRRTGGDLVAVSRFGRGVHVWDPRTGVLVGDIEQAGRADVVAAVPAGPDGHHWIASGDEKQGIVVLWEPDGTFVRQIHTRWPPSAIAGLLRADGTPLLVTGHAGGGMVVWDATAGQRLHDLTGHLDHVMALLAVPDGPDGPEVLSASNDGTIRRWPLAVLTGCSPGGATAELV